MSKPYVKKDATEVEAQENPRLTPIATQFGLASFYGGERLFGNDWQPVLNKVREALPPFGTPDINTEVPLIGTPGSDVHVRCSRHHFCGEGPGQSGSFWEGHPALLAWAKEALRKGEGIGVSYDLREPVRDVPAVYYRGRSNMGFFASLGIPKMAEVYRNALVRLPQGWRCWYTGTFPNRAHSPVRLGIVVSRDVQDGYVSNPNVLRKDLAAAGVRKIDEDVLGVLSEQAAQPYAYDIELDVLADGRIGSVVGINLTLGICGAKAREEVACGSLAEALRLAQRAGLADDRWHSLGEAAYALLMRNPHGGQGGFVACANKLVYVKLRLRDGHPLDAKAYYQTSWLPLERPQKRATPVVE